MNINEAAEKYVEDNWTSFEDDSTTYVIVFNAGALSDAAKQYWFEQFGQIACEFAKWHETLSLEQLVNLPTEDNSPYTTFNDAFKYFMENIYTLNKQTV